MLSLVLAIASLPGAFQGPTVHNGGPGAAQVKIIPLQPKLPVGVASSLSQTVDRIAQLTQKGDFAGARALLRLLPGSPINVEWDDSAVPEKSRFDFAQTRDTVFREWSAHVTSATFEVVKKKPTLRIKFDPGAEGHTLIWSEDESAPRLTDTIGLKQGAGTTDPATLHNEFSFAVGTYLGIAKLPRPGFLMADNQIDASKPLGISPPESMVGNRNLAECNAIRSSVLKSIPVVAGLPALAEEPKPVVLGPVLQGSKLDIAFDIKNSGTSELAFQILPDCSCFAREPNVRYLAPGASGKTRVVMDTSEFFGVVHKTLFLFTNDPAEPVRAIPVEVTIDPRYRILPPGKVHIVEDSSLTVEAYLFAPTDHPLNITDSEMQGLPGGTVRVEPWEGPMADPDRNEPSLPRKGYKLTIRLTGIPEGGQFGSTVVLTTDDPNFPKITYAVYAQKGILTVPSSLFMGEIGAATRTMIVALTRPERPFKITDVSADSVHLSVKPELMKNGDYRLSVAYDGKASKGDYHATITVKTDDPKQSQIYIPVTATVK